MAAFAVLRLKIPPCDSSNSVKFAGSIFLNKSLDSSILDISAGLSYEKRQNYPSERIISFRVFVSILSIRNYRERFAVAIIHGVSISTKHENWYSRLANLMTPDTRRWWVIDNFKLLHCVLLHRLSRKL